MELIFFRHNNFTPAPALETVRINFHELTFVLSGNINYYMNGKCVSLHKGDAVYLPSGCLRARDAMTADYVSFNFHKSADDKFDFSTHIQDCITSEIRLLLSACGEIHEKSTHENEFESLRLILICIINQLSLNLKMRTFSPLTMQIKKYVQNNLDKKITLESVGKAVCFSPVYCSEIFKKETGESIVNYAINEKIKEAKRLLFEDVPLNKIADDLGFENYNYFSRLFKKRVHYSPLRYKMTFYK